ncbi:melanoma-associated antigen 8-like [Kogia breviceps]|uniref:melanoma-associated antigen 8-like n=1 Tax=Kogia breviceps TaxID=27615 RepID=UPI0034D1C45A
MAACLMLEQQAPEQDGSTQGLGANPDGGPMDGGRWKPVPAGHPDLRLLPGEAAFQDLAEEPSFKGPRATCEGTPQVKTCKRPLSELRRVRFSAEAAHSRSPPGRWALPVTPAHVDSSRRPDPSSGPWSRLVSSASLRLTFGPQWRRSCSGLWGRRPHPPSSSSSSSSSSYSVVFPGTLEEAAGAGEPSPPQIPSPTAMATRPRSQSEDDGLSPPDEEGPSTSHDQEDAESLLQDALHLKVADLMGFLLLKYRQKEPSTKAEMLTVLKDYQDHFPVVFRRACECMQLVFGVDVKEVDPCDHSYVLVPTLGFTCDAVLSDGQCMPKAGLLVLLLGRIALSGDRCPEEEVWGALGKLGVCAGREHRIYGEPRELLTEVWVQEGYVEYRPVPHSDPARYEFLWGPRAHAETSEWQVLEHLLWVNSLDPRSSASLWAEGVSDEEEGA